MADRASGRQPGSGPRAASSLQAGHGRARRRTRPPRSSSSGDQPRLSVETIADAAGRPRGRGPAGRRAALRRRRRPQPGPPSARRVRTRGGRPGRSRTRSGPGGPPGAGPRGRRARFEPRRGHARRPRPARGSGLGRPGPGQSRAGGADPRGPRRHGLLRARPVHVPGGPDPDRRSGARGPPADRPAGRHVAGCRAPARAGTPCRWPGSLDASGGSVVALDASASMLEAAREIAEDYAIDNLRTIEVRWPVDRLGNVRRPARRCRLDRARRATTSRRSVRSSPRWRPPPGVTSSRC